MTRIIQTKLTFYPPERCLSAWKADYAEMLENFVYGKKIPFERLLERISELQDRFRYAK